MINSILNYDAYIFDLDGTILDSMSMWNDIFICTLKDFSVVAPENFIQKINHISALDGARYVIENLKLKISAQELLMIWANEAERRYKTTVKLKHHVIDFLQLLSKNNKKIGIATASDSRLFLPCLQRNKIEKLFDSFTTIDEVTRGKAFPDIYLKESEKLKTSPEKSVVFEDSLTGLNGAKTGNFVTVGVFDEISKDYENEIQKTADLFIHNFAELL